MDFDIRRDKQRRLKCSLSGEPSGAYAVFQVNDEGPDLLIGLEAAKEIYETLLRLSGSQATVAPPFGPAPIHLDAPVPKPVTGEGPQMLTDTQGRVLPRGEHAAETDTLGTNQTVVSRTLRAAEGGPFATAGNAGGGPANGLERSVVHPPVQGIPVLGKQRSMDAQMLDRFKNDMKRLIAAPKDAWENGDVALSQATIREKINDWKGQFQNPQIMFPVVHRMFGLPKDVFDACLADFVLQSHGTQERD